LTYNVLSAKGIGVSTLIKLFCFFGFTLESHRCLMLDSRFINVLCNEVFFELSALSTNSEFNKKAKYTNYIQKIEELAQAEGYKVHQLELFLFLFSNNLKQNGGNTVEVPGL
jgi:hypothetical protein